eukprot:3964219-Prymnesium_polylepis.1
MQWEGRDAWQTSESDAHGLEGRRTRQAVDGRPKIAGEEDVPGLGKDDDAYGERSELDGGHEGQHTSPEAFPRSLGHRCQVACVEAHHPVDFSVLARGRARQRCATPLRKGLSLGGTNLPMDPSAELLAAATCSRKVRSANLHGVRRLHGL